MKKKHRPFRQHLEHYIEDFDAGWEVIELALPNVGYVVMCFNGLEKMLDRMLCETFSDRSDAPGLIVLQSMAYSAKVNLFSRFCDDLHASLAEVPLSFVKLIDRLKDAAVKRNTVVHADWESTDEKGFTYSTIRFSDGGMQQEYVQLDKEALEDIMDRILEVRNQLDKYWDERAELLVKKR